MKRRLVTDESGFTLSEMLVTTTIMIAVFFALYSIFDMSVRVFSFGNDKVEAAENARLGLEKVSREIRAAYPYNKGALTPDARLFANMATTSITFGNDRVTPYRVITTSSEEITYSVTDDASTAACTAAPCTLRRAVGTGTAQPVVEYVGMFGDGTPGLKFEYLKRSGTNLVTTSTESEVQVVRITMLIDKSGRKQELTTDVYLRSRSP